MLSHDEKLCHTFDPIQFLLNLPHSHRLEVEASIRCRDKYSDISQAQAIQWKESFLLSVRQKGYVKLKFRHSNTVLNCLSFKVTMTQLPVSISIIVVALIH